VPDAGSGGLPAVLHRECRDLPSRIPSAGSPADRPFVSILCAHGVRIEDISDLMRHSGTTVTETVYRHEIRPAITTGATAMDKILTKKANPREAPSGRVRHTAAAFCAAPSGTASRTPGNTGQAAGQEAHIADVPAMDTWLPEP
jgi:hypothetical protein